MCNQSEWIVREAFLAYDRGDVARLMDLLDPDLKWDYFDPDAEDQQPQMFLGREELEQALRRKTDTGLRIELEQVLALGDKVMLVTRASGGGQYRRQDADFLTYGVVTVRDGVIAELRSCRSRGEAQALAGIG